MRIVFIGKAFVMKIILLIKILAGGHFMPSCSAGSNKKCRENFSLVIPTGFLRSRYSKNKVEKLLSIYF